jgi:hypothetical protein
MAYNFDVDTTTGAYCCEEGVSCQDIYKHFDCSYEELCECNGGYEPECYCGATIIIPERCYKSDYSAVNYSHKSEETNFSSEQGANALSIDGGCGPCYGGDHDAHNDYSKVNYSHKSDETEYSSVQASEQEHVGAQAYHVPDVSSYAPKMPHKGY